MNFYIMTLFPDMVMQGLNTSIIGRAAEKGLLTIKAIGAICTSCSLGCNVIFVLSKRSA